MTNEDESGGEIDPCRLEAIRLAVQWTERHVEVSPRSLMGIASGIEAYLRTGATP